MLLIEGVGPKLAAAAWRQLGVSSLQGFEEVCRSGRALELPRMGPARLKTLLEAIARHHQRAGRMLLDCVKANGLSPVGVGDKDPALHGKYTKGYRISSPVEMIDCDYVLVTSNLYANEVCTELQALGIGKEKLIVI
jgi:hypothetical protein